MFKLISIFALIACTVAAPGHLVETHSLLHPAVVTKTAVVDHSASSAITHQSFTNLVKKVPVVPVAPVVKTVVHTAPVVHETPVVHTASVVHAAPVVHTYATAPVVHSVPLVHSAPLVKTVVSAPAAYTLHH